jgi:phosphate starvation-inducible PhoH-like protein
LRQTTPVRSEAAPPRARIERNADSSEITLAFEDNRFASLVFGLYDQNIAKIERRLEVSAVANGNHVIIKGAPEACEQARRVLEILYERVRRGQAITLGDVDGAIEEGALQGTLFPKDKATEAPRGVFEHVGTRKRGMVRARNAAQDLYLRLLKKNELVFAEGPAGTGKTWLAVRTTS